MLRGPRYAFRLCHFPRVTQQPVRISHSALSLPASPSSLGASIARMYHGCVLTTFWERWDARCKCSAFSFWLYIFRVFWSFIVSSRLRNTSMILMRDMLSDVSFKIGISRSYWLAYIGIYHETSAPRSSILTTGLRPISARSVLPVSMSRLDTP